MSLKEWVVLHIPPRHLEALRRLYHYFLRVRAALLAQTYKRRNIGKGAFVERTVHVLGWQSVRIGAQTVVSEGSWLNVNHQNGDEPKIVIGRRSYIGRRNFFSSAGLIKLGDYCLTGLDCKFMGSNHVFDDPFLPYVATGTSRDGVIEVGANCWLGAGVVIVGNVSVGYGCVVGAGAFLNKDFPPLSIIVGNPARIIRRYDVRLLKWVSVEFWDREADQCLPSEGAYLEALDAAMQNFRMPKKAAGRSSGDMA